VIHRKNSVQIAKTGTVHGTINQIVVPLVVATFVVVRPKLELRIVTKLRKYGECPKAHPY